MRDVLWWIYLVCFLLSLAGIALTILWEEQRAFTTEAVVRDLIALVQGRSAADTKLIHQYLLDMIVSELGYERSVERLGQGFAPGRSVAKRALEGFRGAAGPLYQQLRAAMEPPARDQGPS